MQYLFSKTICFCCIKILFFLKTHWGEWTNNGCAESATPGVVHNSKTPIVVRTVWNTDLKFGIFDKIWFNKVKTSVMSWKKKKKEKLNLVILFLIIIKLLSFNDGWLLWIFGAGRFIDAINIPREFNCFTAAWTWGYVLSASTLSPER